MSTTFKFPHSSIGTVSQNGTDMAERHTGLEVTIHFGRRDAMATCAEVYGGDHHAEIGLEWDGETLTGYDGAFDIPIEAVACLERLGYQVSPDVCDPEFPRPLSVPVPILAVYQCFESLGDPGRETAVSLAQAERIRAEAEEQLAYIVASLPTSEEESGVGGIIEEIQVWRRAAEIAGDRKLYGIEAGRYVASKAMRVEPVFSV